MIKRAYQLKAGNLKNLALIESEAKQPEANEVLIDVKAIGLNFADVFAIWGLYSATPKGVFTPGLEYSGIVLKVGKNVVGHQVGDRVMGITRFGGYSDKITIGQEYVIPLPKDWSFAEGASYLVQVLTAYYGLHNLGNLKSGDNVLIHSAAGGVGIFAGRIARAAGAKTFGTIGSPSKVDFCLQEGYEKVVVRDQHFETNLDKALGGESLNLVMECIGGKIFEQGYARLAPEGRMVVYGSARYASPGNKPNYPKLFYQHFTRPKIDPQEMIHTNRGILGFNLIYLYNKVPLMHQLLKELKEVNIGKPVVGHEFEFEKITEAIQFFQTGKSMGKIVVNV